MMVVGCVLAVILLLLTMINERKHKQQLAS